MDSINWFKSYQFIVRSGLLVAFITSVFLFSKSHAYSWDVDYGANASVSRNDNFRLTEDDKVKTTESSLGVFTSLERATEISSIILIAGASATNYSESSIDDSTAYNLGLSSFRQGERWTGSLDLSYASESTTETELLDTGNVIDGERETASVSPGARYQIDQTNSIYANLGFTDVTYDTVSFTEYTDNSLAVGWVHQLDEISDVSLNASISEYEPDDGDESTIISLQLGYGRNISEVTRYDVLLGYAENESPTETTRDGNSSLTVSHSVDDYNAFSLFVGNGYYSSGGGEARYESRLNLRWDHALAERLQFNLTSEGVKSDDRDYIEVSAGLGYQFTREIRVAANYRFRKQNSDTSDAESNSILLSLGYSSF